jgi:tripartite-type tricarboxylate transporter receptor subunit TctC
MKKQQQAISTAGCAAVLALCATGAWAQTAARGSVQAFPEKPLRMLVPFAPGGNTDILARAVGQKMSENWGKPVVVDNRPGGSGIISAEIVQKATPDGHTIFVGSTGELSINPSLFKSLPYNVEKDYAPVSLGTVSPILVAAHPSFAPKTMKELVDLAKAKPKTLSYASVGIGSPMHLSGELFKMISATDVVHVPYKGGAPATNALIGGREVQFGFVGMGPAIPHVKSGRIKALAISTAKRATLLPDLPTMQEQGVKDFDTSIWFAFLVPAKTPRPVIAKLNAELNRILKLPETRDFLINTGVEVTPTTPEELARFIRAEADKYRKIIQVSGTKLDQ